jgi:hypothetical protein
MRSTRTARRRTPLGVSTRTLTRRSSAAGRRSTRPRDSSRSTSPVTLDAWQASASASSPIDTGRSGSMRCSTWHWTGDRRNSAASDGRLALWARKSLTSKGQGSRRGGAGGFIHPVAGDTRVLLIPRRERGSQSRRRRRGGGARRPRRSRRDRVQSASPRASRRRPDRAGRRPPTGRRGAAGRHARPGPHPPPTNGNTLPRLWQHSGTVHGIGSTPGARDVGDAPGGTRNRLRLRC